MNDIRERLQDTARAVAVTLPPGTGFIVLAFDFNTDKGRLEYVSNADRRDVVTVLKEFIAKTERGWMQHLDEGPEAQQRMRRDVWRMTTTRPGTLRVEEV